jgi:hypothetical protein
MYSYSVSLIRAIPPTLAARRVLARAALAIALPPTGHADTAHRVLVDERFTEYIHWAELDNGDWGVVIPRENEVGEGSSHLLPGTLPVLDRLDVVTLSRMIIFPLSPSQTSSHYHTCRLRTAMRLGGESLAWD